MRTSRHLTGLGLQAGGPSFPSGAFAQDVSVARASTATSAWFNTMSLTPVGQGGV